jgi:16S rRNA processing protein RimM
VYDPDTLAVGVLGKPHGVRGELALRPFNSVGHPPALSPASTGTVWLIADGRPPMEKQLRLCRAAGDHLLVAFQGVDSLDAARALTHAVVRISRQALPPLGPGEYYVEDVVGCDVVTVAGQSLGKATGTFWNGAHDVMSVSLNDKETLIPMVPAVMVAVDLAARRVQIDWEVEVDAAPEGEPEEQMSDNDER